MSPSQLPKKQVAAASDQARSAGQITDLQRRVEKLEKGYTNSDFPMIKAQDTVNANITSNVTTVPVPVPVGAYGLGISRVMYYVELTATASGGTWTGTVDVTGGHSSTHSWTIANANLGTITLAATSGTAMVEVGSALRPNTTKLFPLLMHVAGVASSGQGQLTVTVARTGGTTTLYLNSVRVYVLPFVETAQLDI